MRRGDPMFGKRSGSNDPKTDPKLVAAAGVLAGAVLALDLSLPLGVAGGVPYVAVVLMGWWTHRLWPIFLLAAISTILTAVGYLYSPPGGILWVVLTNRALAVFAIWITAILLAVAKNAERKLRTARDDLDRKVAERTESLNAMNEELQAACEREQIASRTKSQFLALMSHELRTPLNAIIGFSDLLMAAPHGPLGDSKYGDYARDINSAGQGLLGIVEDILNLSDVGSDARTIDAALIDLEGLANTTISVMRPVAEERSVRLTCDIGDDLPSLRADPAKIEKVLLKLVANGIKFTEPGGTVTVRIWHRPASGLVVQVSDTGIGIPLNDIPRVLSPFFQGDDALSRRHGGLGLGLSLAKSFVEMHGGSLDLQSEVGAGTTVTVRLPPNRLAHRRMHGPNSANVAGASRQKRACA